MCSSDLVTELYKFLQEAPDSTNIDLLNLSRTIHISLSYLPRFFWGFQYARVLVHGLYRAQVAAGSQAPQLAAEAGARQLRWVQFAQDAVGFLRILAQFQPVERYRLAAHDALLEMERATLRKVEFPHLFVAVVVDDVFAGAQDDEGTDFQNVAHGGSSNAGKDFPPILRQTAKPRFPARYCPMKCRPCDKMVIIATAQV